MRAIAGDFVKAIALSVAVCAVAPVAARADIFDTPATVTFIDTGGPVRVTSDNPRVAGQCAGFLEGCSVILSAPANHSLQLNQVDFFPIGEPTGNLISDNVEVLELNVSQLQLLFRSDEEPNALGTCPSAGCAVREDGQVHEVGTISWISDQGTIVDHIQVQASEAATPEPEFFVPVAIGVAGLLFVKLRRHPAEKKA